MSKKSGFFKPLMSRRTAILVVAFIAVLIVGFGVGSLMWVETRMMGAPPAKEIPVHVPTPVPAPEVISRVERYELEIVGRMVIRAAHLELEVDDVDVAMERARFVADEFGGFVAEASVSGREERVGRVTIRVPEERFDEALAELKELGDVTSSREESTDVTEQYIDLKARLETRKREERRLLEILEKAVTVEDVLRVEKELWRIREEIERLTGQMLYLERLVKLATITMLLEEKAPKPWIETPHVDWSAPIEMGLWAMATIVQGLITLVIALIPFAAIGVPIYYVYRKRRGRGERVQQTS